MQKILHSPFPLKISLTPFAGQDPIMVMEEYAAASPSPYKDNRAWCNNTRLKKTFISIRNPSHMQFKCMTGAWTEVQIIFSRGILQQQLHTALAGFRLIVKNPTFQAVWSGKTPFKTNGDYSCLWE